MTKDEHQYLWEHFKFNAEQRLKAFNFFVIFAVFADGGILAAIEQSAEPVVFLLIGASVCLLSFVFWLIDVRSQGLLRLGVPGLKEYERQFATHSRLFALDAANRPRLFRYTTAFRILFGVQLIFGLGVLVFGARQLCLS